MGVLAVIRSLVQPRVLDHAVVEHGIRRADAELTLADLRMRRLEARRRLRAEQVQQRDHVPEEET